jgi:hypothetical protein
MLPTVIVSIMREKPFSSDNPLPAIAGNAIGLDTDVTTIVIVLAFAIAVFLGVVRAAQVSGRRPVFIGILSGGAIGLLIPAAWYVTSVLGFDEFDPTRPESLTFTAPVGNPLQYLMTYTGAQANFGIAVVGGVLFGAAPTALLSGSTRPEGFETPGQLGRYAVGAAFMGAGGVMAIGCTIGAGLSGVSTLSVASILALISILGGGVLGYRLLGWNAQSHASRKMVPAE